jgi:hypothetical protein
VVSCVDRSGVGDFYLSFTNGIVSSDSNGDSLLEIFSEEKKKR